jgi:hypothetical protein
VALPLGVYAVRLTPHRHDRGGGGGAHGNGGQERKRISFFDSQTHFHNDIQENRNLLKKLERIFVHFL